MSYGSHCLFTVHNVWRILMASAWTGNDTLHFFGYAYLANLRHDFRERDQEAEW